MILITGNTPIFLICSVLAVLGRPSDQSAGHLYGAEGISIAGYKGRLGAGDSIRATFFILEGCSRWQRFLRD